MGSGIKRPAGDEEDGPGKKLKPGEAEVEEPAGKPYDEMTWPERAADAAFKAAKEAKEKGLSEKAVEAAADEAGEAIMSRAKQQFGYQEPPQRKKFDATKPLEKQRLSPVEQVRSAGLHSAVAAGGKGGKNKGGGHFGMSAPMMSGGMEGGYMG